MKTLELALSKAASLPEAAQEALGRELLERIDELTRLHAEIEIGLKELDAGLGKELDVEELLRESTPNMPGKKVGGSSGLRWPTRTYGAYSAITRREASPAIADRMVRDITETAAHLADRALTWRKPDDVAPGLRSVLCHPYVIFYRVDDTSVEIVRVLHERRDFGAIFGKKKQ